MANDLTHQFNEAKTVLCGLSPGLKALLELGEASSAINEIASSVPMLNEVRRVLPALKAVATTPAGEAGVRDVLAVALVHYRLDMTQGEWDVWWASYIDLVSDVPRGALAAGLKAHMLGPAPDRDFMPRPGKLRELAVRTPNQAAKAADRAQAAINRAPPPELVTRVSKEQVDNMLADYRRQCRERQEAQKRPDLPPTHGKTDETGLTPQMRERIGR